MAAPGVVIPLRCVTRVKGELVRCRRLSHTRDERQPCAGVGPDSFGTEKSIRERSKYLRLWKDILGYATSRKL